MMMIGVAYLSAFCLAYAAAVVEEVPGNTPAPEDVARRELTSDGYVIRHGAELYRYPVRIEPLVRSVRPLQRNLTETNEIDDEDNKPRPLFYFTSYETPEGSQSVDLPYIEIRKKRNTDDVDVPETSKIGKLRRKRTYCGRCGGGGRGGGGYYVPATYAVYPVYYGGGGGGGGGKGCYTCGGGGGGGRGGGGSFSYSSSSAQSSSGSFGWGKK